LGDEVGTYNMFTLSDVNLLPESSFVLNSGLNEREVFVYPTASLKYRGFYTLVYKIRNDDREYVEQLTVKVLDFKDMISLSSDSNEFGGDTLSFYIENKENKEIKGVDVRLLLNFLMLNRQLILNLLEKQK